VSSAAVGDADEGRKCDSSMLSRDCAELDMMLPLVLRDYISMLICRRTYNLRHGEHLGRSRRSPHLSSPPSSLGKCNPQQIGRGSRKEDLHHCIAYGIVQ